MRHRTFLATVATAVAHLIAPPVRRPMPRPVAVPAPIASSNLDEAKPADDTPAPTSDDIDVAARAYHRAADSARRAEREKRAARKILDRVTAGTYGTWRVERVESSRQVADLEAIRATYKRLGLGPVPMKASGPSLKVTVAEQAAPVLEAVAS